MNERNTINSIADKGFPSYTLVDYCREKKLNLVYMKSLGIRNLKSGIAIPYMDDNGKEICNRLRYHMDSPRRFSWTMESQLALYGLWKIQKAKALGRVILVEGESDCHSLWSHGVEEAIGVPGAAVFHKDWVDKLEGLDIYIHHEGDSEGDIFFKIICQNLVEKGHKGRVFQIQCRDVGQKDPSEIHIESPDGFRKKWDKVMKGAKTIDIHGSSIESEEMIEFSPVELRKPRNWNITENGIELTQTKIGVPLLVSRVPIVIIRRLRTVEQEEKVEIGFYGDNQWNKFIIKRSTIFQARTIINLADLGITVTSENARLLVKYLQDLESVNIDRIETVLCVSQMGWYGQNFIPGVEGDLVIDTKKSGGRWMGAYKKSGNLKDWVSAISIFRENNIFRFILASSFAAPLLKLLNHRIFFVHNWGDSRGGKTAALKAALSVWGNPEELMTSFNATKVGLERLAGFFNDLPLGIDERQVVGGKQEYLETLVYMLSMGTSKVRGLKEGGIQEQSYWKSIILTTGEEPLTTSITHTGVYTRALEIYGKPFEDEDEARSIHRLVSENYGGAGPYFIKNLIKHVDVGELKERFIKIERYLQSRDVKKIKLTSHISCVALVTLADELISQWIFNNEDNRGSVDMAEKIVDLLEDATETDEVERAYDFIKGWLMANMEQFKDNPKRERYGVIDYNTFYVFPQILQDILEKKGFSYKKVLRAFGERDYINLSYEAGGKKRQTVVKRIQGKSCRMIAFDLTEMVNMEETPPF